MEYDQESIFRHLCALTVLSPVMLVCDTRNSHFYLDTPDNARKNGMSATSRHEDAIAKRFLERVFR